MRWSVLSNGQLPVLAAELGNDEEKDDGYSLLSGRAGRASSGASMVMSLGCR